MNTEYLRHDLSQSFRLIVTQERQLFTGILLGFVLYALWVGATAAAIDQLAAFAGISTAVEPWTSDTTGLIALGLLLWVVLPAVVAALGVDRAVTNSHGHLAKPYRLRHPATLLVAPLVVVLIGLIALIALGEPHRGVLLLMLLGAVVFHIRLFPYTYRVFSLSQPTVVSLLFVVSGMVVSTALLLEGALVAGQAELVDEVGTGVATLLGIEAIAALGGVTTVADMAVPTMLGLAVVTPLALGGLYLLVQNVVGLTNRVRSPTVARREMRTGQRYPDFAKPTVTPSERTQVTPATSTRTSTKTKQTEQSAEQTEDAASEQSDSAAEPTGQPDEADETDQSGDTEEHDAEKEDDPVDDVSHTRVFRPPSEDESGDPE